MKHYHRENERNIVRIEELERRKTTCEAGLAAMTACWSQVSALESSVLEVDVADTNRFSPSSSRPFACSLGQMM